MGHPMRGATAITGLGITPMGRIFGKSANELAADAVREAIEDSGLRKDEIDGLLINPGITGTTGGGIGLGLQNYLGLNNLRLLNHMNAAGSTAAPMGQYASPALPAGIAHPPGPLRPPAPARRGRQPRLRRTGFRPHALRSPTPVYDVSHHRVSADASTMPVPLAAALAVSALLAVPAEVIEASLHDYYEGGVWEVGGDR